jgi:dipeptidyl aminopeptidase/acylaminoacyl peptidase
MTDGSMQVLDDPNAALAARSAGEASFISWRDGHGREGNGVLILPRDRPRRDLPLMITSYTCGGFLNGSMSQLAPEPLLRDAGFAVLCMSGLASAVFEERDTNGQPIPVAAHRAFLDLASAAIDHLAGQGLIDRRRVGISGHSFSAIAISYAISHSNAFTAAGGEGTTIDPSTYFIHFQGRVHHTGMALPLPDQADPMAVWNAVSPSLNAARIRTPFLMQPPEFEWLLGLQLYRAIHDAGGVAEMYIFPDEGHMVGREPQHQFYRARRSIDWFRFWLQGFEAPDPARGNQYALWRVMRDSQCSRLRQASSGQLPIYCSQQE